MEVALSLSTTLLCPSSSSSSLKFLLPSYSVKLRSSTISTTSSWSWLPLKHQTCRNHSFVVFTSSASAVQDNPVGVAQAEAEEEEEETVSESGDLNQKKKLYLFNLPWSLSVSDIKTLFKECGDVKDVEIIKQKDGRSRGFAFVTMASGDEAQAVIDKFHNTELSGRTITVQFAKRFKKPSPPRPDTAPAAGETRHKLYVSNLAWKVRSSHLRQLFSTSYKPVATRVVFDTPAGKSSGYGFVSFATKEEADEAISELDGTELLGRPIRLTLSERNADASESEKNVDATESEKIVDATESEKEKEDISEKQPEEQ